MKSVLVVDDEKSIRDSIKMILEYEKYEVQFANDGLIALAKVAGAVFDVVLLDIKMAGMDGLRVLKTIKEKTPELPVIMISGHGTIETAVEATKLGAFDFLQKPLDRERLLITVRNATQAKHLMSEVKEMKRQVEGKDAILGQSPKIKEILAIIERVAPTEARVLIVGENGSGKELVARAVHRQSRRQGKQLVEVNCAAIPNELIESELFGHEKGAFTGATNQRIGKFELADGGTLFLDEIGDMSLNAQAKVLRAIEEGKIERVGGNKQIGVDVRLIAATNKNLVEMIKLGTFREDLYHRLNVIPIVVPPLRERRDDIALLANAFADDICHRYGMAQKKFSDEALRKLQTMDWSGNVRELRNIVERLIIMTPSATIEVDQVEPGSGRVKGEAGGLLELGGTFQDFKDRAEAAFIKKLLDEHGWNISRTAQALDIQRSHLYNKMKKFGLTRGGEDEES
ncbi:MAG TPA: Fis family transcriptional regulator [Bacteroidetes bacterium]|jgi:two-component system, NtrC family, nitrogen regulation response regulator NtrX|nr:Fis family transcriptional regulator [Bacteroidota bacterium]